MTLHGSSGSILFASQMCFGYSSFVGVVVKVLPLEVRVWLVLNANIIIGQNNNIVK